MDYKFYLSYKSTGSEEVVSTEVHPSYGNDMAVTIDRESDEWYYKRKLDGKLTFSRGDYSWIMGQDFDGTFTLTVKSSTDGSTWIDYFEGTFSRANLDIDEDNRLCSLSSFTEGVYNAIENGKDEEFDLMKIIPDGDAKEVQGEVHPALAMVDYRNDNITQSDMFCGSSIVAAGYKKQEDIGWTNVALNGGGSNQWSATGAYQRIDP